MKMKRTFISQPEGMASFCSLFIVKHKELKPYLNEAAAHGYNVSVYRMANDFGSVHNVPAETINSMKEHFADFEGETIVRADN